MGTTACARCKTPVEPRALSLSLDGDGMICSGCAIGARAVQDKAGMRKAYLTGAVIVGVFLLYMAARVFLSIR
jgi:recombinational DNA repair protein (RecF pathway)